MICCIVTRAFPVRSETFVLGQAQGLAARGHQVKILSHGPGDGITPEELDAIDQIGIERIHVPRVPCGKFRKLLFFAKRILANPFRIRHLTPHPPWSRQECFEADLMQEMLRQIRPDIVHVQFGITAAALLQAGPLANLVVSWHGFDANLIPKTRGPDVYRRLFASPAMHTANSRFLGDRLLNLGLPASRLTIVPMGVDLETFIPPPIPRPRTPVLRILSVGRLEEVKGHQYLIEAASILLGEGHRVSLTLVGDGEERASLQAQIARLGMGHAVTMLGQATPARVLEEMHRADLFALTGIETPAGPVETQGVVYAEAQATGLPVIASRAGGVPESLIDGETGYLCTPGDPPAIADAIRRFLEDPQKLETFGKCGREFVLQHFNRQTMIDQFETVYLQAKRGSNPGR